MARTLANSIPDLASSLSKGTVVPQKYTHNLSSWQRVEHSVSSGSYTSCASSTRYRLEDGYAGHTDHGDVWYVHLKPGGTVPTQTKPTPEPFKPQLGSGVGLRWTSSLLVTCMGHPVPKVAGKS